MTKVKNISKDKIFYAHRESGGVTCLFTTSIVVELIRIYNIEARFPFPFYGLSFNFGRSGDYFDEWVLEYEKIVTKIEKVIQKEGLNYFRQVNKRITKEAKVFKRQITNLIPNLKKLKNQELLESYTKFIQDHIYGFSLGIITFLYEGIISKKFTLSLSQKDPKLMEQLPTFLKSSYKSFMIQSEELLRVIKNAKAPKKEKFIKKYLDNFFFIDTNYERSNFLTKTKILQMANELELSPNSKKQVKSSKTKLSQKEKNVIELLKITESIRDQRKYIALLGTYTMFRFLEEAVRRNKVPLNLAKRSFWWEYGSLFYDKKKQLIRLKKRTKATTLFTPKKIIYAEDIIVAQKKIPKQTGLIHGTPASPGKVQGRVKVIYGPKDFSKFKEGEILVTPATRPEFVPIMRKALAIITDEGGIVSHAAIVSREFGIPCVVGTKIGSSTLKTGNLIEVDANDGTVKIIKS